MIGIILVIGSVLRLVSLNQSLWLDEAINILAVQDYSFVDLITKYIQGDFHPPGWFMLLWVWGKAFGYSESVARIPSVIFGVITIYIVYLIGAKLISKKLGLLAALLLSINPLHIYYSQEARMYSLATLAVAINVLLLIKLIKGEKVYLLFLILSNAAVLVSDYIAYFIFPAEIFLLIFIRQQKLIKKWLVALSAAILLGIWWLPVFLSQFNVGSIASANLPTWKFVTGTFDPKMPVLTFIKFIIGRINLSNKIIYAIALLPVCSLFAYLLWRGIKFSQESRKVLLSWLIIPIMLAIIVSLVVPVYNYFRLLFVIPAFIILVSLGIISFTKRLRYVFLGLVILIELFSSFVYLFNPSYQREDWRGLVNFFQKKNAVVLFESSGTLPPFDYYAKGKLKAAGALRDFPAKTESDVLDLALLLKDSKEVYLVDYLVQISDPQKLAAKKLEDLGYKQEEIINFSGVGFVYHYIGND